MKKERKNIVNFREDSELFFRMGLKYAAKSQFDHALKYLKKAVDMHPFDVDYQFNYGCVLAELKHTKKSNVVLLGILKNIDPTLSECYFGIGCNHFEMGNLNKAKEYFEKYIRLDLEGQFIDETCDILHYLQVYDEINLMPLSDKVVTKYVKEGKELLEAGLYEKACIKLEKALEKDPEAIIPRNYLSFARFIQGETDLAISIAKSVLKLQPNNIETQCNLVYYYKICDDAVNYVKQFGTLKRTTVEKEEGLIYLLATCFKLNEDTVALEILQKYNQENENFLGHYFECIAHFNLRQYKEVENRIDQIGNLYPQYELAIDSLREVNKGSKEGRNAYLKMDYRVQLSERYLKECDYVFSLLTKMKAETFENELTGNVEFKKNIFYGLYNRSTEEKLLIVNLLADLKIPEAKSMLKKIEKETNLDETLRKRLFEILGINRITHHNKFETNEIILNERKVRHIYWKKEWQSIIDCTIKNSEIVYSEGYKSELKRIWLSFVNKVFPQRIPEVKKMEVWSAALEYIYCDLHMISVSKRELAKKYKISTTSLTNRVKDLKDSSE